MEKFKEPRMIRKLLLGLTLSLTMALSAFAVESRVVRVCRVDNLAADVIGHQCKELPGAVPVDGGFCICVHNPDPRLSYIKYTMIGDDITDSVRMTITIEAATKRPFKRLFRKTAQRQLDEGLGEVGDKIVKGLKDGKSPQEIYDELK